MTILLILLLSFTFLAGPSAVWTAHQITHNEMLTHRARLICMILPPIIPATISFILNTTIFFSSYQLPQAFTEGLTSGTIRGNQIAISWTTSIIFFCIYTPTMLIHLKYFGNTELPEEHIIQEDDTE